MKLFRGFGVRIACTIFPNVRNFGYYLNQPAISLMKQVRVVAQEEAMQKLIDSHK